MALDMWIARTAITSDAIVASRKCITPCKATGKVGT